MNWQRRRDQQCSRNSEVRQGQWKVASWGTCSSCTWCCVRVLFFTCNSPLHCNTWAQVCLWVFVTAAASGLSRQPSPLSSPVHINDSKDGTGASATAETRLRVLLFPAFLTSCLHSFFSLEDCRFTWENKQTRKYDPVISSTADCYVTDFTDNTDCFLKPAVKMFHFTQKESNIKMSEDRLGNKQTHFLASEILKSCRESMGTTILWLWLIDSLFTPLSVTTITITQPLCMSLQRISQ